MENPSNPPAPLGREAGGLPPQFPPGADLLPPTEVEEIVSATTPSGEVPTPTPTPTATAVVEVNVVTPPPPPPPKKAEKDESGKKKGGKKMKKTKNTTSPPPPASKPVGERKRSLLVSFLVTVIAILLLFIAGVGIFVYAKMSGTSFDQKTFSFAERFFLGGNVVKPERVKTSMTLSNNGVHYLRVENSLGEGKTIHPFFFRLNPKGEQEKAYLPRILEFGEKETFSCSGLYGVHFWIEVQEGGEPIKDLYKHCEFLKDDPTGSSTEDPFVWTVEKLEQGG